MEPPPSYYDDDDEDDESGDEDLSKYDLEDDEDEDDVWINLAMIVNFITVFLQIYKIVGLNFKEVLAWYTVSMKCIKNFSHDAFCKFIQPNFAWIPGRFSAKHT